MYGVVAAWIVIGCVGTPPTPIFPLAYRLFTFVTTGASYNVASNTVPFTPLPDWSYQVDVLIPGWSRERISPCDKMLLECAQCVGVVPVAVKDTPATLLAAPTFVKSSFDT